MADDNIDFRFLGRQVQNLQGDVRDLRAGHLRLEGDVVGLRADLSRMQGEMESLDDRLQRLEQEVRVGFKAVDDRLKQMAETAATDLEVVLAAIDKRAGV